MITLVQESCGIATAHIWGEWRRSGGGGACPTPFFQYLVFKETID